MTSMPKRNASLANIAPIAPRPMTPNVLPEISVPANWLLPFSTCFSTSSPLNVWTQSSPSLIGRAAMIIAANTSSLTALAFAPGVLKTTTPASEHSSTGTLLTPAPARAMAFKLSGNSMPCSFSLRRMMPSGFAPELRTN